MLDGKSILVTGGTGSFGKAFCKTLLQDHKPERVIVYSRDEFKQSEMALKPEFQHPAMRFFLGDVRDTDRLTRAMDNVDYVVHAAALKQVPAAEYNPHEFIKTNINGATNVVNAALDANVSKVLALSTDKAVNPVNLYGATKLCSDKVIIAANSYRGRSKDTRFSVVRYGNVLGSRGSVIPLFLDQRKTGTLTITDPGMTRFYIQIQEAIKLVIDSLTHMHGGELFVPKIKSCTVQEIADAIGPDCEHKVVGIRPGEKMHEVLIPQDDAHYTEEFENFFVIKPMLPFWQANYDLGPGKPCPSDFSYASNNNPYKMTSKEIYEMIEEVQALLNSKQHDSVCL